MSASESVADVFERELAAFRRVCEIEGVRVDVQPRHSPKSIVAIAMDHDDVSLFWSDRDAGVDEARAGLVAWLRGALTATRGRNE